MFEDQLQDAAKWQHIVDTANPILDGAIVLFNFRNICVGTADVESGAGEQGIQQLEFIVGQDGVHTEPTTIVDVKHFL